MFSNKDSIITALRNRLNDAQTTIATDQDGVTTLTPGTQLGHAELYALVSDIMALGASEAAVDRDRAAENRVTDLHHRIDQALAAAQTPQVVWIVSDELGPVSVFATQEAAYAWSGITVGHTSVVGVTVRK